MIDSCFTVNFNSIKVRLERATEAINAENRRANFNSIKVRLEQAAHLFPRDPTTFQFHKGTIRTKGHSI